MLSKNSSVSRRNACRRLSSKSGKTRRIGRDARQVAQVQPLAGEVVDERLRARIGQHPPHLLLEHGRIAAAAAARPASSSSSSGMLLHRKNDSRDASSRSLMRYAVSGGGVRRIALDAEQELRADEHALERPLDAGVEAAARARPRR